MIIKFVRYRIMDKVGESITENWNYIKLDKDHTKACCDKMQTCVESTKKHDSDTWELEIHSYKNQDIRIKLSSEDYDGNESSLEINNCPFCGEKIEYEQIKIIQKINEKVCKEIKETRCQINTTEKVELDLTEPKK